MSNFQNFFMNVYGSILLMLQGGGLDGCQFSRKQCYIINSSRMTPGAIQVACIAMPGGWPIEEEEEEEEHEFIRLHI